MGIFNNTSYTNEKGKTIPARMSTKYKKDFLGFSIPTKNPEEARDTVITITPDAPLATTQRIHLSGPNSRSEHLSTTGDWVPSDYQSYWIPRGREALKNYGNQPSPWTQLKNKLGFKQNGGTIDKVNYFQQGGTAAQKPDMKAQVVALVQAAMQGDQKATQQVNQIMEAAKAGDQQAMQIAQLMEQVIKELQGQATSAKWGSKLGYIKSLKYAKGGKTCSACEKKVEMKACGGKKAKKRYFGGLV